MIRRPPRSTRTDTLVPYTTLFRSLTGAMVLSLTFVPASVALFLGGKVEEKDNRVMQWTKRRYAPALAWSLRRRRWVLGGALALFVVSGLVAMRLRWEERRVGTECVSSYQSRWVTCL